MLKLFSIFVFKGTTVIFKPSGIIANSHSQSLSHTLAQQGRKANTKPYVFPKTWSNHFILLNCSLWNITKQLTAQPVWFCLLLNADRGANFTWVGIYCTRLVQNIIIQTYNTHPGKVSEKQHCLEQARHWWRVHRSQNVRFPFLEFNQNLTTMIHWNSSHLDFVRMWNMHFSHSTCVINEKRNQYQWLWHITITLLLLLRTALVRDEHSHLPLD